MNLTEKQLALLQETLSDRLKYSETYDEVYDHVLTALEDIDDSIPLGGAVNTIMLNDFGGFKGLRKIENERRWTVAHQMISKQLLFFADYLKFPLLPIAIILYAILYYIMSKWQFTIGHLFIYYISLFLIVFCGRYWKLKTGYRRKKSRKSIKLKLLMYISQIPFYLFSIIFFVLNYFGRSILKTPVTFSWYEVSPMAASILLTLYIIYLIAFFRLFKSELATIEIK